MELVVRTSHAIAALTGMKDQKSDETISEDEAKKKIQTLFPKSFSFFETELKQMKEWNSKIEERLQNTNSAPLLESKETEGSTLDKTNTFADQTITSPDDAAVKTSLNMDDADLMKGIKTQENNPNPDSSYRGIGIKVTVENEGLKMVDIFSPNVKRFKVLNQKSSGSFVDSDGLLPSIGAYITTIYIQDPKDINELQEKLVKNLSPEAIASFFHQESKNVVFGTSDGKIFSCDNTINKSAIFSPNKKTPENQSDFIALSELIKLNENLATEAMIKSIAKSSAAITEAPSTKPNSNPNSPPLKTDSQMPPR